IAAPHVLGARKRTEVKLSRLATLTKIQATQRAACYDRARRHVTEAGALKSQELWLTIVLRVTRVWEQLCTGVPIARKAINPIRLVILQRDKKVTPVVGEGCAVGYRDERRVVVALASDAALYVGLETGVVSVQHEVDYARDGIRSPRSGSTARHNVHPLNQGVRQA